MRYMVEENFVEVVGKGWYGQTCATRYDIKNVSKPRKDHIYPAGTLVLPFTRKSVEEWLSTNAGDFQSITDFRATVGDKWIEFATEEGEMLYNDCMFPCEEEVES